MEQTKYIFRYRNANLATLRPNGDRYLIEVLDVDEEKLPSGIFLPEATEEQKGWAVGVVFSVGNGHRLEIPDHLKVIPEGYNVPDDLLDDLADDRAVREFKEKARAEHIGKQLNFHYQPSIGPKHTVARYWASVPMFFAPGEVVGIERYSGRQFTIQGRSFRIVSQVDVLLSFGTFLRITPSGWVERDLEAEAAEAMKNHPNGKFKIA